ncbi:MAG: DUF418 domain-containing protein [Anaeromyxobacter sp.]
MEAGTGEQPLAGPASPAPPPAPLAAAARLPALDALRGLALLGVVAVNAPILLGPDERVFNLPWAESAAPRALAVMHLLFVGKAYTLLSFLFGAGLALQAGRLGARAPAVLPRRLAALGLIGAAHGLLLWHGDILAGYALVGLVWYLAFHGRDAASRARWALGLFALVPLLACSAGLAMTVVELVRPDALTKLSAGAVEEAHAAVAKALAIFGHGTYGELFRHRAGLFLTTWFATFAFLPQFLALFLAGGWAVEQGVLSHPGEHEVLLGRVARAGITLGGVGELVYAWLVHGGVARMSAVTLGTGLHAASAPALALGLAAALLLAWARGRARLLLALAPLGRVSLSAYLGQSALFTTIAYAYGLGLYGALAPDACLALAIATWLAQALLAALWVSRFELGPAEWLWRWLTYGRAAPARGARA